MDAALLISIVALAVAIASAIYTKRGADAARRSARADERSASTAETANRREIRRDQEAAAQREAEVAENRVRWVLRNRHEDGATCRLDNMGTHTARGVSVSLPSAFNHHSYARNLPQNAVIEAKASVRFDILALSQVDHVFVSWEGHPEPQRIDIHGPAVY